MGYTHYWRKVEPVSSSEYEAAIADIAKIVEEQDSVALSNWEGEVDMVPKTKGGISFNGVGGDSHETFDLPETVDKLDPFTFCKTARKPYDVVVTACLTRLAEVYGIKVSSDGNPEEWTTGVLLASKILGRPLENPFSGETPEVAEEPKDKPEADADNTDSTNYNLIRMLVSKSLGVDAKLFVVVAGDGKGKTSIVKSGELMSVVGMLETAKLSIIRNGELSEDSK